MQFGTSSTICVPLKTHFLDEIAFLKLSLYLITSLCVFLFQCDDGEDDGLFIFFVCFIYFIDFFSSKGSAVTLLLCLLTP